MRRASIIEKMKYFQNRRGCVKMELTFGPEAPDPFVDFRYYTHAFDVFLKRLKRVHPKIKYFRMVEIKEGKPPHFHIILDRFVSHEWVTENFPECGGGKINWEKWIDSQHVFSYITKYITKATSTADYANYFFYISGMRQLSYSRGLFYIVPRNHSYYVVSMKPESDPEIAILRSRRSSSEFFYPLSTFGVGPPDVYLVSRFHYTDLFTFPASVVSETRESLRKKRFDQKSWQAKSQYPIYQ
jgi:hypothetical protein